jgi:hypothetical protein
MKKILAFFFTFLVLSVSGQVIQGVVLDENDVPVENLIIRNGDRDVAVTNELGGFNIQVQRRDRVHVFSKFWKAREYVVRKTEKDTIKVFFKVQTISNDLDEVAILQSKYLKEAGASDEDVLDYYPISENEILTLKERSELCFLSIENIHDPLKNIEIKLSEKAKSLHFDALGNFHVIYEDSVAQFYIKDSLLVEIARMGKIQFDHRILPLVSFDDTSLVTKELVNQDKAYILSYKSRSVDREIMYSSHDEVGDKVALSYRNEIIGVYMMVTPSYINLISLGEWTGDLFDLVVTENFGAYNFMKNCLLHPIEVESFEAKNQIVTIDLFKDSVFVHDKLAGKVHQAKFDLGKKKHPIPLKDLVKSDFYIVNDDGNFHFISKLDVVNGNLTQKAYLNEFKYPYNFKVFNGFLYFISQNKNGFHKLMRLKPSLIK